MPIVELSDEDAKYFKLFRKYQEQIEILLGANQLGMNVLNVRAGKVTISISIDGIITDVDVQNKAYNARGRKFRL